jgi:hypothetical protein
VKHMCNFWILLSVVLVGSSACVADPEVPTAPSWADVEPILRGSCTHCHGSSARETGSSGTLAYRFDFYDMTPTICGDAAQVLEGQNLARAWAPLIKADVTSPGSGWRPRMPPAPAESLADWQRETLVHWASQTTPPRGEPGHNNGRPDIQLDAASATANKTLNFSAVITDPDGEAVVGILKIGDLSLNIDRSGAFATTIDTSTWVAGRYPMSAVLCDGWDSVTYDLGAVNITHGASATVDKQ